MKRIKKFVPSRLLTSEDDNQGIQLFSPLLHKNEAQKYAQFFWKAEPQYKHYLQKTCKLTNPSKYNFFKKIIFDLQITTDRVHPVQISSRSDNCITIDIM